MLAVSQTYGALGHPAFRSVQDYAPRSVEVLFVYNGNPAVINAMLGGQIQMALMPPAVAMPHVKAGKLQAVGLAGPRSPLAPDVASLAEVGVRMSPLEVWGTGNEERDLVYVDDVVSAMLLAAEKVQGHGAFNIGAGEKTQLRLQGMAQRRGARDRVVKKFEGIFDRGYRVAFNVLGDAGMTIWHLHLHVLGGRPFHWPPG